MTLATDSKADPMPMATDLQASAEVAEAVVAGDVVVAAEVVMATAMLTAKVVGKTVAPRMAVPVPKA
jgi:hypothetical protein